MEKIIQISSGKGPAECSLLVKNIFKELIKLAEKNKLKYEIIHIEEGMEKETYSSVIIKLIGFKIENYVNDWIGTIQWICQSPYRPFHKRKNWFAGVKAIDIAESTFTINDSDLEYQAIRSGGPGGQHVNKVSTAIRLTHKPSGISVLASDSKSQLQNKKHAKERLLDLMRINELEKQEDNKRQNWMNHNCLERGNPVKVFVGEKFKER
jgi:peptide chain release factor